MLQVCERSILVVAMVLGFMPLLSSGFLGVQPQTRLFHRAQNAVNDMSSTAAPFLHRMSSSDEETTTPGTPLKKRRRKRKATTKEEEEEESSSSAVEISDEKVEQEETPPPNEEETAKEETTQPEMIDLKPRDDTAVELKIRDVREVVGVVPESSSQQPTPSSIDTSSFTTVNTPESSNAFASTSNESSSFDQLLEDARRMQAQSGDLEGGGEGEENLKGKIRNVLSTIVTADFFVVCGFLVWFVAGIFCSTILNDDTVQIAFNSNFQAFVQPALGVLMLGTIVGNFLKDPEEEDSF